MDHTGNIVSRINENGLFFSFVISHTGLLHSNLIDMISCEKIKYDYVIHNNILFDNKKIDLKTIGKDNYFVIVTCYD
jgi:hypothetical protein